MNCNYCGGATRKFGFNVYGNQRFQCKTCFQISCSLEIYQNKVRPPSKRQHNGITLSKFQYRLIEAMKNGLITNDDIAKLLYGKALEYVENPRPLIYAHLYCLRKKGIKIKTFKMKGYILE
jgi:hypothetical protein